MAVILLLAGCSPLAQGGQAAEATVTATPDPLYSLHCIRQAGRNELCYAGQMLLGDNERLEKVSRDYCNASLGTFGCSLHIWVNEGSVARKMPLTETETASRIARFTRNPNTGVECFEVYDKGEVVYASGECGN